MAVQNEEKTKETVDIEQVEKLKKTIEELRMQVEHNEKTLRDYIATMYKQNDKIKKLESLLKMYIGGDGA